jgi:hypothetical protein
MVIWVLAVGMSLTLSDGKLDAGAQVEAVFRTKAECQLVKNQLDAGSKEAISKGQIDPKILSFGAVCVEVPLTMINKVPTKGV